MLIKKYENEKQEIINIWNESVKTKEVVFKPMTSEWFDRFFVSEYNCKKITYVAFEGDEFVGVISGAFDYGNKRIFVTYINVKKSYRNKGIGDKLLAVLEEDLKALNPEAPNFEISFYSPMPIEWFIPGTDGHDHPCAPGLDIESPAYEFFKKHGYADFAVQLSFYLQLKDYVYPQKIADGMERLKEHDIEVCFYDKNKHYGFPEFFDALKNEGWRQAIMASLDKEIVIGSHNGKVCGYSGPLSVQASGRGGFHGIGVHPEYRKLGLGTIIFANLCKGLSDKGATFMSLYTGAENPARFIYEGAGFHVVKRWADMRKKIG